LNSGLHKYMQIVGTLCAFLFFSGTGVWTPGLHLESLHQPFFFVGFFKIGSLKLFAQTGFEPRSSCSLPPE
jgi:hypothetical protein